MSESWKSPHIRNLTDTIALERALRLVVSLLRDCKPSVGLNDKERHDDSTQEKLGYLGDLNINPQPFRLPNMHRCKMRSRLYRATFILQI